MNGGLRLACNPERWEEVKRQATTATSFGLEMQLLSPKEAQALWPLMEVDDLVGAAFLPTDGQANPSDITMALAKGARQAGATIVENAMVERIDVVDGRITGVVTNRAAASTARSSCCAPGQWTRQLAATVGVNVPLVSVEHQYVITEPMDVPRDLPTLRDPDRLTYYKEEVGGLVMGGYEPNPKPWVTSRARRLHVPAARQRLGPLRADHGARDRARARSSPTSASTSSINGPESFTPDGMFILGEAPELRNCFVGAGLQRVRHRRRRRRRAWRSPSGSCNGAAPYDLWNADIRRFGRNHRNTEWVRTRTLEAYAKHYTMAWPFEEHDSGRPNRRSPLYDRLARAGRVLRREARLGAAQLVRRRRRRRAAARRVLVRAAELVRARRARAPGDARGGRADRPDVVRQVRPQGPGRARGAELDLRERRRQAGRFAHLHADARRPRRHPVRPHRGPHRRAGVLRSSPAPASPRTTSTGSSATSPPAPTRSWSTSRRRSSVLALMGPASRAILEAVTDDDVTCRTRRSRSARCDGSGSPAARCTRCGSRTSASSGTSCICPSSSRPRVYDALMAAGRPLGLVNAGYRAIESCRLEKGYRAWGSDIGPDHTPIEAGMAWAVKDRSGVEFLGREAIAAQRDAGVRKRLAGFTTDPSVVLLGRETIYRDGERVGWLSSAGFGYTLDRSIGYGYVRHPDGVTAEFVTLGHATSWRSRPSGCRARCRCNRSTTRRASGSGRESPGRSVRRRRRPGGDARRGAAQLPRVARRRGDARAARRRHHEPQRGRHGRIAGSSSLRHPAARRAHRAARRSTGPTRPRPRCGRPSSASGRRCSASSTASARSSPSSCRAGTSSRTSSSPVSTRWCRCCAGSTIRARSPARSRSTASSSGTPATRPRTARPCRRPTTSCTRCHSGSRLRSVASPDDPVPCHNDLLPGNVLFAPDRTWLLDFEYAGMNDRYFDLANLSINCGLDAAADERLLARYFGRVHRPSRAPGWR